MGAIISLGSTAACCFGSAACAICNCCPSMCNSSIASRIMYSILLLLTTVVCCIMLAPGLQDSLASVPFCKSHESSLDSFSKDLDDFGSKVGLGNMGQGVGIGSNSLQVSSEYRMPLIIGHKEQIIGCLVKSTLFVLRKCKSYILTKIANCQHQF